MTDITDQDRHDAWKWAANVVAKSEAEDRKLGYHTAARVILELVDKPANSIAEDLRELANEPKDFAGHRVLLLDAAARAEKMSQERDRLAAEVKRINNDRPGAELENWREIESLPEESCIYDKNRTFWIRKDPGWAGNGLRGYMSSKELQHRFAPIRIVYYGSKDR